MHLPTPAHAYACSTACRHAQLRRTALLLPLLLAGAPTGNAHAQAYPTRPVTIIVPVAPAGILDQVTRIVAPTLGTTLGQQIIVENRAGASGNIGATAVARSKPDGYTRSPATRCSTSATRSCSRTYRGTRCVTSPRSPCW
jgi:tripartite-type tricarboxylate transporter receptor subunit TctC